jgi:hypothetical protein
LAFNNRFYDLAIHYPKTPYILIKSYYSQVTLIFFFAVLAFVYASQEIQLSLDIGYWLAALLTPLYFLYSTRSTR